MNAGFASLTKLKEQLLAEALRADTAYDAAITALGLGVAGAFDKFCNRKLARAVATTFTCRADRDHIYLDRYPIESISTVEMKVDQTTGWETQTDFVFNQEEASGFVYWGLFHGNHASQLRFTFTGGYWIDDSEESTGTLPAGATALPEDLRLAWYLQCKKVWEVNDPLGTKLVTPKSEGPALGGLELLPLVQETLKPYRRFQIA